jgi:hypothetical protein
MTLFTIEFRYNKEEQMYNIKYKTGDCVYYTVLDNLREIRNIVIKHITIDKYDIIRYHDEDREFDICQDDIICSYSDFESDCEFTDLKDFIKDCILKNIDKYIFIIGNKEE